MIKNIEIGKKLIIQCIILIGIAWLISLVVAEIFNIKLKNLKIPNIFQPNIIVKIYKDNKKKNTFKIKNIKEGFVSSKNKKYIQKIKNPFKSGKKIEKFQIEEFTNFPTKLNCSLGNTYKKQYDKGLKTLGKNKLNEFTAYNSEDSGYTHTFIK